MITKQRRRPEEQAKDILAAETGPRAIQRVAKTATVVKAVDANAEGASGYTAGIMRPTDEQLDRINQYTRSTKTADDVVSFTTMSANDIMDRDLDRFRASCVKTFAKMPEPFSPVGKPFMISHDATKLPVGRLFGVDTKRVEDNLFLTNEVFMPNTEQYRTFLENIDFGIYNAVSVGVTLNKGICSVGDEHAYMGKWWCSQGHEKGLHYDPKSEETDGWGWPEPVDPSTKGAVLCTRDFDDPQDFYELSMVYLGAQYGAELAKSSGFVKTAKQFGGFVNLGVADEKNLPIKHINPAVVEAKLAGSVIEKENGSVQWVDSDGWVQVFDPDSNEVLTTGKEAEPGSIDLEVKARRRLTDLRNKLFKAKSKIIEKATDDESSDDSDSDPVALAQAIDAVLDEIRDALDSEDVTTASDLLTSAETTIDELIDILGGVDADESQETDSTKKPSTETQNKTTKEDAVVSKKSIQAAARQANVPAVVLDKLAAADEDSALNVFCVAASDQLIEQNKMISRQQPLVKAGESYLKTLRDDIRSSFILARQAGNTTKAVDTSLVDQLIKLAADDTDLLMKLKEEYHKEAQSAFPAAVRRSSFATDANVIGNGDAVVAEPESSVAQSRFLNRIHQ